MTILRRFVRLCGNRRGSTFVESAVSFSILMPVLLGSWQFGYAFYNYNKLQTAVLAGVRYASVLTYNSATSTPDSGWAAAVRNTVVYGDPTGGSTPVTPDLTPSNVDIQVHFVDGVPRQVTVGIIDYTSPSVVKMLDFSTKPKITMRYTGRFDPLM